MHIFVLGRHLGFANCGGLGRGKICRGSRWEVEKTGEEGEGEGGGGGGGGEVKIISSAHPLTLFGQATIQDGGIKNLVCRAFRSKITPALQASQYLLLRLGQVHHSECRNSF